MMRGDRNSAHGAVQSLANFDIQNRRDAVMQPEMFGSKASNDKKTLWNYMEFMDQTLILCKSM